jgi:hypothetical protein
MSKYIDFPFPSRYFALGEKIDRAWDGGTSFLSLGLKKICSFSALLPPPHPNSEHFYPIKKKLNISAF